MYKNDLLDSTEQQKIELINILLQNGTPPYFQFDKPQVLKQLGVNTTKLTQIVTSIRTDLAAEISSGLFEIGLNRLQVSLHFTPNFNYAELLHKYLMQSPNVQMLLYLLTHSSMNKQQINTELGINASAYFRRIRYLNQLLTEFDIQIKNGILVGNELNIRHFYNRLGIIFNQHPLSDDNNAALWQTVSDLEAHLKITFNPDARFIIYWNSYVIQYRRRFMRPQNLVGLEDLIDFITPMAAFETFLSNYHFNYSTIVDINEAVLEFTILWVSDIFTSKNDNFTHFYAGPYLQGSPLYQRYRFCMNQIKHLFPRLAPSSQQEVTQKIWLIVIKLTFTKGFLYTMTAFEISHYHYTIGPDAPVWPQEQVTNFINEFTQQTSLTLDEADYQFLKINLLSIIANTQNALMGALKIGVRTNMHLPLARRFYSHILQELTYFSNISIEAFNDNKNYDYVITNIYDSLPINEPHYYILGLGVSSDYANIQVALLQIYQNKYSQSKPTSPERKRSDG
ncbi:helix-turn-helix domain-containing protein [Lentilactobacillus kribbianus]|uniref:helix-turn-helix domain-containing protein n=1 Tax=Lentilactobacillus kribbianus TaxID=2729622 RepID=UPI0015550169|nr:helix-turn-helix domain-containing protein [Lentilactobacillus kribbianus]